MPFLATLFITISTGNENSSKQEEWNFFQVTHLYRHNKNCCCYLIMYQAYDFVQVIPSWKFNSLIKSIVAYNFNINELPVKYNSWSRSRSYCLRLALIISDYYSKNAKFVLFYSHSELIYTAWLKYMDSISYVYISWTMHGMWMIYITFEREGPKFSITTAECWNEDETHAAQQSPTQF